MTLTLEKQQVMSQIQQLLKELTPLEKLFLSEQLTADIRSQLFYEQIAQEEKKMPDCLSVWRRSVVKNRISRKLSSLESRVIEGGTTFHRTLNY